MSLVEGQGRGEKGRAASLERYWSPEHLAAKQAKLGHWGTTGKLLGQALEFQLVELGRKRAAQRLSLR